MNTECELTDSKLDTVVGGLATHTLGPDNYKKKNVTNAPSWGPAMDAWNKLLHQYGYA